MPIVPPERSSDASADPTAIPTTAPRGLGGLFVRGMLWGTGAMFVSKFGSAVTALCLGWIFGAREYSAANAAIGAAIIGDVLTDGGLRRVLITRGPEYARLARTAFAVALVFNLLGCALLLNTAALYRSSHPEAVGQLVIFGIAMVVATFGTVQRCKLSIDMRFAQNASLGAASSLLRNLLTVGFALLGFGPLAFALPLIVVNLWEAAYLRRIVGPLPPSKIQFSLARQLALQGRWVILSMIGGSLIARGDFLAASWMLPRNLAGQYFFAFYLTISLFSPLSAGIGALVQPILARLSTDPARQAGAFLRIVRASTFVAVPMSLAFVLGAPLLIHLAWNGRWDVVTPLVQVLAASECVRQLLSMNLAALDARGEWHRSAAITLLDGALTVMVAVAGCATGSVFWLATSIAIQRSVCAIVEAVYVYMRSGGGVRPILIQVLPPLAIAAPITAVALVLVDRVAPSAERLILAVAIVPALACHLLLCWLLLPLRLAEAISLVRQRLVRRPSATITAVP